MPNWCQNDLAIKGPRDFLEEIAKTELSLAKLVPYPKELENMEKTTSVPKNEIEKRKKLKAKYGVDTLFDWCVKYWGTKWDISLMSGPDVEEGFSPDEEDEYYLSATFDSAWSPPVEAMKQFYKQHKDKKLEIFHYYFEPGCAFLGSLIIKNGKIYEEDFEYKTADELEAILKKHENPLAENEVESMREYEAMKKDLEEKEKLPKPKYPPGKIPAKYTGPKAAAKPAKKTSKPAKKVAKKATAKPAAKPVKKAAKVAIKAKKTAKVAKAKK